MKILQPFYASIVLLIKNTPSFRSAVSTGSTGTAGIEVVGVAKYQSVVNVVLWLTVVIKKTIFEGFSVVAYLGSTRPIGELVSVAFSVVVVAILANVVVEFPVHSRL